MDIQQTEWSASSNSIVHRKQRDLRLTAIAIPPEQLLWHVFPPLHTPYALTVNKC